MPPHPEPPGAAAWQRTGNTSSPRPSSTTTPGRRPGSSTEWPTPPRPQATILTSTSAGTRSPLRSPPTAPIGSSATTPPSPTGSSGWSATISTRRAWLGRDIDRGGQASAAGAARPGDSAPARPSPPPLTHLSAQPVSGPARKFVRGPERTSGLDSCQAGSVCAPPPGASHSVSGRGRQPAGGTEARCRRGTERPSPSSGTAPRMTAA
jgi:hypothetical protein